ncbi:MAG: hypothetical protein RR495_04060 [Anaerovoracaceae bacterium]
MIKKRILAMGIIMVLAVTSLAGCGSKKEEKAPTTLSGSVKVAALEGAGTESVANLKSDYKITKCATSGDMVGNVLSGGYDVFIMSPTTAGQMNERTSDNLVEISPITLGGISIVQNSYVQGTKTVRVYNEKTKQNEYKTEDIETPMSYLRGKTIVAYGKEGDASEYVLKKLLNVYAGMALGEDQIEWIADKDDFITRLGNYQTIGLASEPVLSELQKKNKNVKTVFDLNQKWKEKLEGEIPMDVLVVSKEFYDNRRDDLNIFLNDYAESIVKAKETSKTKLMLFTESNRGINILKQFNKTMYEFDAESFGGEKPKSGFYFE